MEKVLELAECEIKVIFEKEIIRVFSNAELWRYLKAGTKVRMDVLVKNIKENYLNIYHQPLKIACDSLIVEILVHVYCDYLGLAFNRYVKIKFIQGLVNKLLTRAAIVDCGEKHADSNRWIWDILARFKSFFIWLMPDDLNRTGLKKW